MSADAVPDAFSQALAAAAQQAQEAVAQAAAAQTAAAPAPEAGDANGALAAFAAAGVPAFQMLALNPQLAAAYGGAAVPLVDPMYAQLQANAAALYQYAALAGLTQQTAGLAEVAPTPAAGVAKGSPSWVKPGDWNCKSCGDLQFARNSKCRRCGADKPSEAEIAAQATATAAAATLGLSSSGLQMRPGDWICTACGDHVFAKNTSCRKCGTPRPNGVVTALAGAAGAAGRTSSAARDGDWNCKMCGDLQFARNATCRRCGTEKPADAGLTPAVATAPASPYAARVPGGDLRPGDWMCPRCGDHVFARNEHCRRCGQTRPTGHDMAAMAAAGTLPPTVAAAKDSGEFSLRLRCLRSCYNDNDVRSSCSF
ncbi:RANBP2 [Symbiodinium natans]|uniref:RANBP2 protein n=1 Tax=Symbiodinium natans TaxID=878477 RepID=A0A812HCN5_9DINO|nr:RANBP2 [Symbiodinium natans]